MTTNEPREHLEMRMTLPFQGQPEVATAALDTPLPTPAGWMTVAQVEVGDQLIGADGKPCTVAAATDVLRNRDCFEVVFDDRSAVTVPAEHLWLTDTRASRKSAQAASIGYNRHKNQQTFAAVRTTAEIATTILCKTKDAGRRNHTIVNAKPLELPDADLPLDPYVLGAWLGDGHSVGSGYTSADAEILDYIRDAGITVTDRRSARDKYAYRLGERVMLPRSNGRPGWVNTFAVVLRQLGVEGNKHIPYLYLRASVPQRLALLQGLMDTDGTATTFGHAQFAVTSKALAEDTRALISTLGYKSFIRSKPVKGRRPESSTCYIVGFTTSDKVFRIARKADRQVVKERALAGHRFISEARPVASQPTRLIRVDSEDGLYLIGRTCIPTSSAAT